ncbi:hypothetical protein Q1695_010317 [Nippostrongylus brasiliensis]|nr:hypothetical protein Q1695_010317 [Nippostrongylus brasiliensis]
MLRRTVLLLFYFWALYFGKTADDDDYDVDEDPITVVTNGTLRVDCEDATLGSTPVTNVSWKFTDVSGNNTVTVYSDDDSRSAVFYKKGWNESGTLHCEDDARFGRPIGKFQIVTEKDFKRVRLNISLENWEKTPRGIIMRFDIVGGDFIKGWRMDINATSVINGEKIDSRKERRTDKRRLFLRNVPDEGGQYNVSVALYIVDQEEHKIRASELTSEFQKIVSFEVDCKDLNPENNEKIELHWSLKGVETSDRDFMSAFIFVNREKRKHMFESIWEKEIKPNENEVHENEVPIKELMEKHSAIYIGICAILVRDKSDPNMISHSKCCNTPISRKNPETRALTETPQMLQANVSMDSTVDVSFEPVPRYKLFGTDDGCQPSDGRCERKDLSPKDQSGRGLVTFTFQGKSNTYYFVRARCASNGKPGPFTEWLRIRTPRPEVPRPPVKLRESTSAKLKMKLRAGWRIGIGWRTYMKSSGKAVNPKVIDRIEVTRTRHYSDGTYGKSELIPIKSRSDTFVSPAYTFSLGCYVYTVKVYFPAMTYVTASEELCFDMLSASYGILYLTILLISILFISFKMATQERPQDYAPQRYTRIRY